MSPGIAESDGYRGIPDLSEHPTEALEVLLRRTAEDLFGRDSALITLGGKLLRPRMALGRDPSPASFTGEGGDGIPAAALAIQLAHEASLLHDDVVDEAEIRRDRPTAPARDGTAAALIAGDRLLTLAYRAAAATASPAFFRRFSEAVDLTVAGEARQGRLRGRVLDLGQYRSIIEDKSGALFGIALAARPILSGQDSSGFEPGAEVETAWELGVRVGALYQMVDDILDYCPDVDRGKPPLTDLRQKKWTLPLVGLEAVDPFALPEEEVLERLYSGGSSQGPRGTGRNGTDPKPSPLRRALRILEEEAHRISGEVESLNTGWGPAPDAGAGVDHLQEDVRSWAREARNGVRTQEERSASRSPVRARARDLGGPEEWPRLFGRHSRSFHFAARLFSSGLRERVTGIYVFCRFTDDLVDEADLPHGSGAGRTEGVRLQARLDAWRRLTRDAHGGMETGIPILDHVVRSAGERGIPLAYLEELLNGVEMDIHPSEFSDLDALRTYTYRVASVVGGWISEELGVRDPGILDRAFALGHAMQMTNILRDVGEDLRAGRLYLPLDRMAAHGILRSDLEAAARGRAPVPVGYSDLLEELMEYAEDEYRFARTGLHALPRRARYAVAVAARVYRGIHEEIRGRDYDSLTGRAYTTRGTKLRLALRALLSPLPRRGRP